MNLQIKISYQVSSKKYKKQFHTGTHQTEIKEHQRQKNICRDWFKKADWHVLFVTVDDNRSGIMHSK